MKINHLLNARVVKDIWRVATTNMKPVKIKLPLMCNDARAQRSDENSEEAEPLEDDGESKLKVNPMKILEIYLKIIVG
ncbi:hypothetical protein KY284_001792 [Solanum tuberosum]|nr:hypothetical protein KY284_001792 [Solanum tuberosum]